MTIMKANNNINNIMNQIEYLLSVKDLTESKFYDNLLEESIFNKICIHIDTEIDILYKDKNKLESFIEQEQKKTDEYDELLKEIIYYKEEDPENYSWEDISYKVNFSESYCKKLYGNYKKKRDI